MQLTGHALTRLRQRQICDVDLQAALEHGEWNARGDRLVLTGRAVKDLIALKREALRRLEREASFKEHLNCRAGEA